MPKLRELGARHVAYSAQPERYPVVGEAWRPEYERAVLEEVEPGVDARAGGEGLEAKPVDVARHDRVGGEDAGADHPRRLVVARAGDLADDEERGRRLLRPPEEAGEEVGMASRPPEVASVTSERSPSISTVEGAR